MHLTNKDADGNVSVVSNAKAADAGTPAIEIEITPEMIEVGAYELSIFSSKFDSYETGAENIFLVMLDKARVTRSGDGKRSK